MKHPLPNNIERTAGELFAVAKASKGASPSGGNPDQFAFKEVPKFSHSWYLQFNKPLPSSVTLRPIFENSNHGISGIDMNFSISTSRNIKTNCSLS